MTHAEKTTRFLADAQQAIDTKNLPKARAMILAAVNTMKIEYEKTRKWKYTQTP